jgi:hypothetical protein
VPPQTDEPYHIGFGAAGQQIGLVPGGGPQAMSAPVAYSHVPDIEAKLAEMTAAASWQPSLTSTAMSSDCCRTPETGRSARMRHG